MINKANVNITNECISSINILDCLLNDIEIGLIKKSFQFSIDFMMDNFNIIKFNNIQSIVKSFYTNNLNQLKINLIDLKKELKRIIKNIYDL